MEKALVDKNYLLEKYPGKGGWTFARIARLPKNTASHFGFVKVKGTIDGVQINKYHLMPIKGGGMFLPVKAEIRKKIKKEAGDYIRVILYADNEPLEVPAEMLLCLQEEPAALHFFQRLSENEQKLYIQWVYSAKKIETKINRLAATVNRLLKKQKLHDRDS